MRQNFKQAMPVLAALVALAGCTGEKTMERPEPGTPIRFGVSTRWENGDRTRTEYSGRDENDRVVSAGSAYERIDWVEGRDRIRIACEAASAGTVLSGIGADYVLGVPADDGRYSRAGVTPEESDGLHWGRGDHYFYALYPAPGTVSNYPFLRNNPVTGDNARLTAANHSATVTGVIPSVQEAILESSTSTYKPNMNHAYMYASKKVDADAAAGPVSLSFRPLVTTLEFTLKNFAASPVAEKLTRAELRSASSPLAGTFSALLSTDAEPVITTEGTTGRSITINFPDGGIVLSETTPVRFTFLTLPVAQSKLTLALSFGPGHSIKRSLDLKDAALVTAENPEGWITVDACRKTYISNVSVPGDLWIYTLDVTGNHTASFPMAGGNPEYTVASYRTSTTDPSVKEPVAWTTMYSVDGGEYTDTMPEWLQDFTAAGPGSTSSPWERNTATLSANDMPMHWEGSRVPVATERTAARDLSCYDIYGRYTGGVEGTTPFNTANCYVVGAPGWYRIPCVYGNAIKHGADNPSSYNGPDSGERLMTGGFLNHADAHVTGPWIRNNKAGTEADSPDIVLEEASLVWQDHEGLITDVVYDSDYLYFQVSETDIFQGNALLAVKAGGEIVWSWHVWVMDNPETRLAAKTLYSHPTVNHSAQDPMLILPMNLGFCDTSSGAVRARNVRVKFIQDVSGDEKVISISQLGQVSYNNTYYQWGRKDPMPPGVINYGTIGSNESLDKELYDMDGHPMGRPANLTSRVSIGTAIRNPMAFVAGTSASRNWTYQYDNLWNTNILTPAIGISKGTYTAGDEFSQDIRVWKTIYDPCPPGFKIPNKNAFSGFTSTGRDVPLHSASGSTSAEDFAIEDINSFDTLLGVYFYLDQNDPSKGTVFMSRTGSRQYDTGDMGGVGNWADYTSAAPVYVSSYPASDREYLSYFTFGWRSNTRNYYVHPFHLNNRGFGFPVRPIGED